MILLGTCSRLRARISEAQCNKNRHGVAANPKAGTRAVPACFSCEGCAGLIDLRAADYLPRSAAPPAPQPAAAARSPLPPPHGGKTAYAANIAPTAVYL